MAFGSGGGRRGEVWAGAGGAHLRIQLIFGRPVRDGPTAHWPTAGLGARAPTPRTVRTPAQLGFNSGAFERSRRACSVAPRQCGEGEGVRARGWLHRLVP